MKAEESLKPLKPATYVFGEFRLEAENLLLLRDSEVIPLAPKACEVLLTLLQADGKLITKQEILDKVWADAFVEEANLTHHISALRKALGEDKNGKRFIETIPRKGYRFVAPVNERGNGAAEIIISERMKTHAVEEIQIQTNAFDKANAHDNQPPFQITGKTTPEISRQNNPRRGILIVAMVCLIGAMIVAAFIYGGRLFSNQNNNAVAITPQSVTFKRLTPDVDALGAAISPDGKTVAFKLLENGQQSIWRKNVATGEMAQLMQPSSQSRCGFFRYSPDGGWLYFKCDDEGNSKANLYRIPAAGGIPQKIRKAFKSDYGFSPDGKQIVFVRQERYLMIGEADGSGEERRVVERDDVKQYFLHGGSCPAWSPDGRHIVTSGVTIEQGKEIYELVDIDLQTGGEKIISSSPNLKFLQVHWLADGSGLITTASEGAGLPNQINHVSYPDGKITPITNDTRDYGVLQLTKDTRTMIAQQNLGQLNLWTAPANDSSQRKQITMGASARHGDSGLAFTPDGKIIYTSPQSGNLDLWQINADGSGQKQLTNNSGKSNESPQVTPDGRYIVFQSNRSGSLQIWRMDADGRNPVQLSRHEQAWRNQISPDGKWVYHITSMSINNEGNRAYKVSIDGGEPVLFDNRYYVRSPNFSPDGKWLFYNGRENDAAPLHSGLMNVATGEDVRLPEVIYGKSVAGFKIHHFYRRKAIVEIGRSESQNAANR